MTPHRSICASLLLLAIALGAAAQEMSLREQAWTAMSKKDFALAKTLLEKWVVADPGDGAAWYNLASAYAMTGNKVKAIESFGRAVSQGFLEKDVAEKDPNLDPIRSEPGFKALWDRFLAYYQESIPDNFIARMAPMKSLGTYVVMLPPDYEKSDKSYPLVLVLHGNGSNEIEHGRIVDDFGRDGVIYAAVRAPFASLSTAVALRKPAFTAWPTEGGRGFEPARDFYIEWIFDVAEYVRREFRVKPGKIFIWGHSQGGQFAKFCALTHPEFVASYFSQAGSLVGNDYATDARLAAMKRENVDVWLVHGKSDNPQTSVNWAERLKSAGIESKLFVVEGDHSINREMRGIAARWISEVVKKNP